MKFMRRYGWLIFILPIAVYVIDDYETNWHDHGHERILYIILHNVAEDTLTYLVYFGSIWWQNRTIPHVHAECPKCHFRWLMHPKQKIAFYPHCGAPEPS